MVPTPQAMEAKAEATGQPAGRCRGGVDFLGQDGKVQRRGREGGNPIADGLEFPRAEFQKALRN